MFQGPAFLTCNERVEGSIPFRSTNDQIDQNEHTNRGGGEAEMAPVDEGRTGLTSTWYLYPGKISIKV